ncbi:MAG: Phage portal protein, partial [Capsulimonas sp.]|nr:Phage portal protein [Capsulimonas sp.]
MVNLNPIQKASRWLLQKSGLPMGGYGSGGRYGGRSIFYGLLPGSKVDYQRQAGSLWRNSIVAASINWIGRNLPQAPPCVYQIKADGTETIVPKHPLTKLLMRPNPYYSGRVLRIATFLSLIVNGNAYWYIIRGMNGKPKELW